MLQLHPQLRLRRENWAVVFYRRDRVLQGDVSFVHPRLIYLVLSSLAGVLEQAVARTGMGRDEAEDHVRRFLDRHPTGFVHSGGRAVTSTEADPWLYEPEPLPEVRRLSWPIELNVMVTDECCFRCRYCCITTRPRGRGRVLGRDRFREIIEVAAAGGSQAVTLHGGEPALHPELVKLVQDCTDLGLYVTFSTKATLSADLVQRLAVAGLTRLQVSIDSPHPDRERALTGASLDGLVATVKNAVAHGIAVTINTIVSSHTARELEELAGLCAGIGATEMALSHYSYSRHNPEPEYLVSGEELARLQGVVARLDCPEFRVAYSIPKTSDRLGLSTGCASLRKSATIGPDGDLVICDKLAHDPDYSLGVDLAAAWNGSRARELVHPPRDRFAGTACEKCEQFDSCLTRGRCIYRSLLLHGTVWAPDMALTMCETGVTMSEPHCDQGHRLPV